MPHTDEVRERRGFIALGHLYDYADKVVYRHEQTFPKHKSDRMSLFKATRAYCEQIYMLYSDPAFTAEKLIFGAKGPNGFDDNPADLAITDEYGVVHKVWKLTDPNLINLIVTAMADKKLIIADGHHRYETSVAYAKERSAQLKLPLNQPLDHDQRLSPGHLPAPAFPEAAMMMTFVNMEAPGITILPTHRVVHGLEGFSSPDFITRASACFDDQRTAQTRRLRILNDNRRHRLYRRDHRRQLPAHGQTRRDGRGPQGSPGAPAPARRRATAPHRSGQAPRPRPGDHHPPRQRQLPSRGRRSDGSMVARGDANIAFLIKPITLEQLKDVSLAGDVMPQKSTDFYPKLLSGLAIYALD